MTTVYLVRHAHADWEPSETRPLSVRGRASAEALAARFSRVPITAIYSSPARRALETIEPLARHFHTRAVVLADLRERELATRTAAEFDAASEATWREPNRPWADGESNAAAQVRGLAVVRRLVARHHRQHVMLATHGTLLALVLNGLDSTFGYDFWRTLTFPDVYELTFRGKTLAGVRRAWAPGSEEHR
jgi:2,3-bisphosphoglycerate-dependent phosphoglycerate mutase